MMKFTAVVDLGHFSQGGAGALTGGVQGGCKNSNVGGGRRSPGERCRSSKSGGGKGSSPRVEQMESHAP